MSEVMRWKLKGFIPGVEGVSKALFQPWVVPAEDFDAALAREAALQARLNVADQRVDDLEALLTKARELLKEASGKTYVDTQLKLRIEHFQRESETAAAGVQP